jgi:hypothetical protein
MPSVTRKLAPPAGRPASERDVPADPGHGGRAAFGPLEHVARELLHGDVLGVGVSAGVGHELDPDVELVVAAAAHLNAGHRGRCRDRAEVSPEHVLERNEPVSAPHEQVDERRVA